MARRNSLLMVYMVSELMAAENMKLAFEFCGLSFVVWVYRESGTKDLVDSVPVLAYYPDTILHHKSIKLYGLRTAHSLLFSLSHGSDIIAT